MCERRHCFAFEEHISRRTASSGNPPHWEMGQRLVQPITLGLRNPNQTQACPEEQQLRPAPLETTSPTPQADGGRTIRKSVLAIRKSEAITFQGHQSKPRATDVRASSSTSGSRASWLAMDMAGDQHPDSSGRGVISSGWKNRTGWKTAKVCLYSAGAFLRSEFQRWLALVYLILERVLHARPCPISQRHYTNIKCCPNGECYSLLKIPLSEQIAEESSQSRRGETS